MTLLYSMFHVVVLINIFRKFIYIFWEGTATLFVYKIHLIERLQVINYF